MWFLKDNSWCILKIFQINSQQDMFATQPPTQRPSQPKTKPKMVYGFVVLCDKDNEIENPFSFYPRHIFSKKEILDRWLSSTLDNSSRLRSLNVLEGVPNKTNMCLFGKIEAGVPKENIEATIKSLNHEYNSMISNRESQTSALYSLVTKHPYRLLTKSKNAAVRVLYHIQFALYFFTE